MRRPAIGARRVWSVAALLWLALGCRREAPDAGADRASATDTRARPAEAAPAMAVARSVPADTSDAAPTTSTRSATGRAHHVAPNGRRDASGSAERPWDLATALAHPRSVHPGDTIWLRAGVYHGCFTSRLAGLPAARIVVRARPAARATLDGAGCRDATLTVEGAWTVYWGLEVMNSNPRAGGSIGVNVFGDDIALVNLVVHDNAMSGVGAWSEGENGEIYGSIIYNNGVHDNLDHAIYAQNKIGTKRIVDNIMFDQLAYGLHVYGSSSASLAGFRIEGNVAFNNGTISRSRHAPQILVGGGSGAERVEVLANMTYQTAPGTNVRLGYGSARNRGVVVRDNYIAGGSPALLMTHWSQATVTGNTLYTPAEVLELVGDVAGFRWSHNTHYREAGEEGWTLGRERFDWRGWRRASRLGDADRVADEQPRPPNAVFVRPNRYERGRAHIIVYNWERRAIVSAAVSEALRRGERFVLRDAQDFFGAPVLEGVYDGTPLQIPMRATRPPVPLGGAENPPPVTGPEFGVFVLLPAAPG